MPCIDPRDGESEAHARAGMVACCYLIKWLENNGVLRADQLPSAVFAWWQKHQARDAQPEAPRAVRPFTIADIGRTVRVIATGEPVEIRQVGRYNTVMVFTRSGFKWKDAAELERGEYVSTWVPEP